MAAAGHAYPSDEDDHTVSTDPAGLDPRRACHQQQFQSDSTLIVKTPERRTATDGASRSHPRNAVSDQRRHVFRRLNDVGNITPHRSDSCAPRSPSAAPSTPQPYRSRSDGATADAETSLRLHLTRSAPQPLRSRARTYSHGVDIQQDGEEECVDTFHAGSAPDWATGLMRTPPRRIRARTLSYDTPPRTSPASSYVGSDSDSDEERGTPLRRTTSCDDEALQRAAPHSRRPIIRAGPEVTTSSQCRRWTFAYGRKARALVSVALYLILVTLSPLIINTESDQTGMMNKLEQPHRQSESDFGKEIQFNGMGIAIENDHLLVESNEAVSEDSDVGGGIDSAAKQMPAKPKATLGEKKKVITQQRTGRKKKRRPVVAQARSLGLQSRPVFVPKMEQEVQQHTHSFVGEGGARIHNNGVHEIRTFSLSEEDLKAPLPEELLPPDYESGPSTMLKILTLSAWICLTILVLETGFREIQRRFHYVNLRQLRAQNEDRSR